jgi:hypothetical protein
LQDSQKELYHGEHYAEADEENRNDKSKLPKYKAIKFQILKNTFLKIIFKIKKILLKNIPLG